MDAAAYFRLTHPIAAARTDEELAALGELVDRIDVHLVECRALERVLRPRADTLRLRDIAAAGGRRREVC